MINIKIRTRNTKAVEERARKMRSLVQFLQEGEKKRDEIIAFLGLSASSTRTYVHEMQSAGVLELRSEKREIPKFRDHSLDTIFTITDDQDALAVFLDSLHKPLAERKNIKPPARVLENGRHIHLMSDDVQYSVKPPPMAIPAQWDLLAQFFGRAQVQA